MFPPILPIVVLLTRLSSAIPPPSAPSLPSLPPLSSLNTSLDVDTRGMCECKITNDWLNFDAGAPFLDFQDCEKTLRQLLADSVDFGRENFEWLSLGTPFHPVRGGPKEGRGTPKRYVHNTCTLCLVFLRDLKNWPSKPPPPYPDKYVSDYLSLYQYGKSLWSDCVRNKHELGWIAPRFGFSHPMALFFWQTGSRKDRGVPNTIAGLGETA
ncbi:MAG: hypothetical protein Q9181_000995 [Wetmoreana brouardii]